MLTLYVDTINDSDLEIIHDVEKAFTQIRLTGTDVEKELIQLIDKGSYNDSNSFIDRWGYKLYLSELSTGCKAALCVISNPDKLVDLIECGNNARDIIISRCKTGNVLMYDNGITFRKYSDNIQVVLDEYLITTVDRLNYYMFNERPFKPDLTMGGIKCIR